ncbi:hypothetical protein N7510_002872 [Penicillium lagena]|uniref:uncharacterized protein n=1 Tax=Penicillium lagena TaxID=94218 RepID=UPI00253FC35E|nr:uncharacterized protein N7510_002872 [Penicillium lagena]KAJ5618888.1 hypothetical protein N7510_002872 [Penicillium lagena]
MKLSTILSALASLTAVTAIPLSSLTKPIKRDPSDTSGNSQFVLQCEGDTIPNPGGEGGAGEGGSSYFYSNLLFNAQGTQISPDACTSESAGICSNCIFSGGGLSSATNVTGCWNPPGGQAGCSIQFMYNGYDYNSQNSEPYCGHVSGFEPFQFDLSAICYFDVGTSTNMTRREALGLE